MDGQSAWANIQAGGQFVVSPNLNPEMTRVANRSQVGTALEAYGQDPSDRESSALCLERVMPAE